MALFVKPLLSATVSIGLVGAVYYVLRGTLGESYSITLISIAAAVALYALCSLKMKAVVSEDVLMLPMGEKIEKLLRKVKLL